MIKLKIKLKGLDGIYMQNKLIRMSNNDSIVEYLNKYV